MKKEIKINKTLALRIYGDESISLVSYKMCEKNPIWTAYEIETNLSIDDVVKLVDVLCRQVKRLDNKLHCKKLEGEED